MPNQPWNLSANELSSFLNCKVTLLIGKNDPTSSEPVDNLREVSGTLIEVQLSGEPFAANRLPVGTALIIDESQQQEKFGIFEIKAITKQ